MQYDVFLFLTPSDECEAPEVFGVWAEGHEDEAVKVEAFHQDPVVVGGQKIDEKQHRHLAADLITKHSHICHLQFVHAIIVFNFVCLCYHDHNI